MDGRGEVNEAGRWGRGGRLKMDERVGEREREVGAGRGVDLDDRTRKLAVRGRVCDM
jgi:hypothetical protein